jgi:hypothetical protein
MGMKGEALARGALVAWLVVVSVLISSPVARWAQILLLGLGLACWAVSAFDAVRLASGTEGGLLAGRRIAVAFVSSLLVVFSISFIIGSTVAKSTRTSVTTVGERTDPGSGAIVKGPLFPEDVPQPEPDPGSPIGNPDVPASGVPASGEVPS